MSLRRPHLSAEFLQWFGLGAGALVWASQHVIGYGTTVARCGAANAVFSLDLHTWELTTGLVGVAFCVAAQAASVVVVVRTSGISYDGPPPDARRRFFALAALVANTLFLVAILFSSISSLAFDPCRQG
ncbi:MAG TPA: hypothetical protein VLJ76_09655 [Gaiellaceae bacterium]|nr:hypothetical protein [Gaiellaceae bacterium]